jgi:hypothetical protein
LPGQGVCRDVLIEAGGDRFTSVSPGIADTPAGGHFTAEALLQAATAAGHASLGWPDAGEIVPAELARTIRAALG